MVFPALTPAVACFDAATSSQMLVVIDPHVEGYEHLAAHVRDGAKVYILDSDRDGIAQITELLQRYSSRSTLSDSFSLHIVSHGSPSCLYLGNTYLNLETIAHYTPSLQSWFPPHPLIPLSPSPQLLLYGCNVATGDAGREFLEKLHHLTGANIAASNTRTGNAALGGNWDLAARIGEVKSTLAFQAETMATYAGVLENALFIGPDASASILNSSNFTDFKFEMRVRMSGYRTNSSGPFPNLMRVGGTGNSNATSSSGWKIVYDTNAQALYLEAGGTMSYYVSCPEFSRGDWVTIGVQHIPGRAPTDFYINGSYITSAPGACNTTADIYFGGVEYFQGLSLLVDDVRLSAPANGVMPETPLAYINFETYDPYLDSSPYVDDNLGGCPDLTGNGRNILVPYNGQDPYSQLHLYNLNRPPTGVYLNSNAINENSPSGTVIGSLYTNDPDPGDSFTYTLLNDAGGRFIISGNQVYSVNSNLLNYEANTSHDILVRTTDRAGAYCDQYLNIQVRDINEAPTNVVLSPANVDENVNVGTLVGSLFSTDLDANNTFSYQIVAGTGDTDNAKFELVGNQIKLKELPDFETQPTYSIRVRTTDQNGLFFEKQLTVTVNDRNEAPTSLSFSSDRVNENITPDTTAATFITLDPDALETLTYSLVSGNGDTDNATFQIIGNQIYFVNPPDYETKSSYSLRVKVTDKGGLTFEQPLTFTINDINEVPTSLNLSNTTVNENSDVAGAIGTFTATDPDTNETYAYSLESGTGDTDNAAFQIIGNQLHFINTPDYETQSSYSIRVGVTDAGGLSREKIFTVTVNDINDAPTDISFSDTAIADGILANSVVGRFSTTDQDANEQFIYGLVSGFGDADNSAFTLIDNELRINRSPNANTQPDYNIRVRTIDKAGASFDKALRLVVNSNNAAPTDLSLSRANLDENNPINALVGALSTTDADANNTFIYSLIGGSGAADNAAFAIVGNDLILKNSANFEAKSGYSVRIRTTDQAGSSFDKAFNIAVNDINEAPTNLALSNGAIAENSPPDSLIGTLSSSDPDANNRFTYSLVTGSGDADNGVFAIAADQLTLKASPNFEAKPNYKIRLRTTDQDGAFFDKALTIRVNDLNEAPTNLSLSSSSINENVPVNSVVGKLATVDPDANNAFAYSLVAGSGDADNAVFAVVGNELRIQTSPDFETKSSYNVRVRTTDQNGLSFEKPLTIQVKNLNEAPTGFTLSSNKLNEGAASGTAIGTLRTTDPDAGNTFTYSLVAGTGSANNTNFAIAGNQLRFQTAPAGTAPPTYSIRIRTTDQNGLSFEESVPIQVNAAPTDILLSNSRIAENEPANTAVGNLAAIDRDAGNTFTYQLVAGTGDTGNSAFAIVNNQLQIKNPLDFEQQPTYSIRVQASDQDGAKFQKSLEVLVGNINEAPTSLKLGYSSIPENQVPFIPMIGVDQDVQDRGRLAYSLVNGAGSEDNSAFYIQGTNLIPRTPANYEQKSSYSIRLRVQDPAGAYLEQPLTLAIRDVNEAPTNVTLSNDHIAENTPANSIVGYITGFDPDAGDSITYSLVGSSPDNNAFWINGNQLAVKAPLDFEAQSSYDIWIQTTDRNGLSNARPFTIKIDDQAETGIPNLENVDVKSSLRLDGVNDYIKIAKESTFDITNAITVEGWFRVDRWDKPWQAVITKGDSAWRIARAGESNSLEFAVGPGSSGMVVQGNKNVNDGSWHHVAGVYDGASMKLYVDGNLDAEKQVSGSIATNDYDIWIGANAEQPGRNFAGQLDEFRVWNIARSQSDIQSAKRQNIDASTPGLVGYWKLNDGAGTVVASSKAGDNNGTLVNSDGTSWSQSSPVLSGQGSDNEYKTWSQLSSALDQFSSQGNSLGLGTKDILHLMFNVFEAGEPDPDNTVTAIANLASNKIELSTARSASVVSLAQLMNTVAQFADISAPESALSAFQNIPIPLLDSTLTISSLGAPLPTYQFSTRVTAASNLNGLNFLSVIQDYLGVQDFTWTAQVEPLALSAKLTANLIADKTIFDVAGFQIAFLGGELTTAINNGNPSIALKPILKLKNYDPFQSGEPDLTLNGNIYFDPDAFVGGLQLSTAPGNAWKNPFGIPDSELRNVGFELGGTFETPYVRQVKVLGDLKFGNYDVKAGFIVNKKDDKKNAIALTVNKPLNAIDLLYGPVRSFALNQLANQIPVVQDGLKFLNQIVPLNLVSIDGNNDGTLDPLISFSREATSIVGQKIKAGVSINGELTAWGKKATLIVDCDLSNTLDPKLTGALTVSNIDWGFIKLSGVNQPNLSLNFNAQFAQNSRINIPIAGVSLPTSLNAYFGGTASLNLFGQNVARADFNISTSQININKFDWDLGVLGIHLNSFNFDTKQFTGAGSGQISLYGKQIAQGSFSLDHGNFFAAGQLGIDVVGQNVGISAQIKLGKDGNRIHLDGSALGRTVTLVDSSLDLFVNQFKSLSDLTPLVKQLIPGLDDLAKSAKDAISSGWHKVFDGYIADGTVFFDANLNGVLDSNEPFTVTDAGGNFKLNVDLTTFDTNKNKQIDASEGQYVMTGGTDISTGLPMATPLSAVFDSGGVISPLTTIVAGMAQQDVDPLLAQTQVKKALGLSADVDLTSFDPLQAIAKGNAKGVAVFASMVMAQNTIVQASKFANGVSNATLDQLSNGAIAAIANQVKNGTPVDFSQIATIQAIVEGALTKAAAFDPNLNLSQLSTVASTAAQVIAQGNRIVQEQVVSGRPLKEIALNITRAQAVSVGQIAANLPQLAAGKIAVADFLTQNTREAILNWMAAVQVNDPTLRPVMPNKTLLGTNRNDLLTGDSGNDVLSGKKGNDYLFGRDGNDRLRGDSGNDILTGGEGNDILTGGKGRDRFALNVAEDGKDTIADFKIKEDLLQIGGLPATFKSGKPISISQFHLGSKAIDKSDRFIYSQRTGALFYDADGAGGSQQTQIAQLSKGLQLTARDVLVG